MSPQANVWRLQRKKIQNIPTLTEIKDYQKYLRKKTAKIVFTSAMAILLIIAWPGLFQKYFAHSNGYQWIQSSWAGGIDTNVGASGASGLAKFATDLTTWTKYFSKAPNAAAIDAGSGGVALHNYTSPQTVTETGGTYSGALTNGNGSYALGNTLKLKKPTGGSCGAAGDGIGNGECKNGSCVSNACN